MDKKLQEAKKLLSSGNIPAAREIVDEVIKKHPSDSAARNLQGLIFFRLEYYDEALNVFQELVEEFPREISILVNLGLSYLKKNQYLEAVRVLEKAIRLDPHHKKAYNYLGLSYANLNLYQKARDAFKMGDSKNMVEKMEQLIENVVNSESQDSFDEVSVDQTQDIENKVKKIDKEESSHINQDKLDKLFNTIEMLSGNNLVSKGESEFPGIDLDSELNKSGNVVVTDDIVLLQINSFSCYTTTKDIIVASDDLEFKARNKKYKGKELKSFFSTDSGTIHEVFGRGKIILRPEQKVTVFNVDEDNHLFVKEKIIYAYCGDLKWENGRLPNPAEGNDLQLVQFRGSGEAVVVTGEKLYSISLNDESISIPTDSFVGWLGDLLPRYILDKNKREIVMLRGDGRVFFVPGEGNG